MKGSNLFKAVIGLAIICALVGVYYLIPGVYHVASFHTPDDPQNKHAIVFFVLAVVLLIASRFTRPRPATVKR